MGGGGYDVTSDLSLDIGANVSRIAVSCNAVSRGHYDDAMVKRAEKEIVVLSKKNRVKMTCFDESRLTLVFLLKMGFTKIFFFHFNK